MLRVDKSLILGNVIEVMCVILILNHQFPEKLSDA